MEAATDHRSNVRAMPRHRRSHLTWRRLGSEGWPWLVVAAMFVLVGCWWGLIFPAVMAVAVFLLRGRSR